jgi:hypothetical protein
MVVLLTYGLCNRKQPVSHLTSAARLACSGVLYQDIQVRYVVRK